MKADVFRRGDCTCIIPHYKGEVVCQSCKRTYYELPEFRRIGKGDWHYGIDPKGIIFYCDYTGAMADDPEPIIFDEIGDFTDVVS